MQANEDVNLPMVTVELANMPVALGGGISGRGGADDADFNVLLFGPVDAVLKVSEGGRWKGKKYLNVKVTVLPSHVLVDDSGTSGEDALATALDSVLRDARGIDIPPARALKEPPTTADHKIELRSGGRSLYLKFSSVDHRTRFMVAVTTDQEQLHLPWFVDELIPYVRKVESMLWDAFDRVSVLRRFYFHAVLEHKGACRGVFKKLQRILRDMLGRHRLQDCEPKTMVDVLCRVIEVPALLVLISIFDVNLVDYRDWSSLVNGSPEDLLNYFVRNFESLVTGTGLQVICALYQFPAKLIDFNSSSDQLWLESAEFAAWYCRDLVELLRSKMNANEQRAAFKGTAAGIYLLLRKFLEQCKSYEVAVAFSSIPVSLIKSDPFPVESAGGGPEAEPAHFSHILFHSELAAEHRDQIVSFLKREGVLSDDFLEELIKEGLERNIPRIVDIVQHIVFNADGTISDGIAYYGSVLSILSKSLIAMLISRTAVEQGQGREQLIELPVTYPIPIKELFTILLRYESLWCIDYSRYNVLSRNVHGLKQLMKASDAFKAEINAVHRHSQLSLNNHLHQRIIEATACHSSSPGSLVEQNAIDLITGFFVFALEAREAGAAVVQDTDSLCQFLSKTRSDIYRFVFAGNSVLRARVYQLLVEHYRVRPRFKDAIAAGLVMTAPEHFLDAPLRAMAMDTQYMNGIHPDFAVLTVVNALSKLEEVDHLDDKLHSIELDCAMDRVKALQLYQIMQEVYKPTRLREEFANIQLATLDECSLHATIALNVLRSDLTSQAKLAELLKNNLRDSSPDTWCSFFNGASTIAFFIKYLARENLDKAYNQFAQQNQGNQFLLQLIGKVRQQYLAPLVNANELTGTAVDDVISELRAQTASSDFNADEQFLRQVFVEWMLRTKRLVNIAMVPRNTQVLTFLIFAEILSTRHPSSKGAFLAQIGTGEGKSLIIAMLALYQAKVKGKKVHVLSNNIGLLQRDYESFREFYDVFQVTSAASDLSVNASIVYCQRRDIEEYYRDQVQANQPPFRDTVLIVDEVDQLIVDESPNTRYVETNTQLSDFIFACFSALKADGEDARPPSTHRQFNRKVWNEAKEAYTTALNKTEGVGVKGGYQLYKGKYRMNGEETGELKKHNVALWLEYINFDLLPDYRPVYQSRFYLQCMVYMLQQYEQIIGLSGSLGSPAEIRYLTKTYNASCFTVPPFLSTCNNVEKESPVLIDDCAYIYETYVQHDQSIADRALVLSVTVPVLIIMETDADVLRLFDALNSRTSAGRVQKLLQVDNGANMPWTSIVRDATVQMSGATGYRITITNYWGGRGHDYVASDENVSCFA